MRATGSAILKRLTTLHSLAPLALAAAGGLVLILVFVGLGGLSASWSLLGVAYLALMVVMGSAIQSGSEALHPTANASGRNRRDFGAHEEMWSQLLETIPDAAIVLDHEQRIIQANKSARDGFRAVEGIEIMRVSRDPGLLAAVERAASQRQSQSFEMRAVTPIERYLEGSVTPIFPKGLEQPLLVVLLHDRTEFEQLAQMRADFVANASHELRTPLASLRGFIETLQGAARNDPAAQERFLAIMNEQATRMTRLIDDLLTLSRIEMRVHVRPRDHVDLSQVLRTVTQTLGTLASSSGIEIRLENVPSSLVVTGEHDELVQVFQNLMQNAIKYGRTGGSVRIQVETTDAGLPQQRMVKVAVIDDGPGIAPEHVPRLTERFYRVNPKDSRDRGGTGLGLAIVKHIVTRHGGDLQIASVLGKGSTFSVLLPGVTAERR